MAPVLILRNEIDSRVHQAGILSDGTFVQSCTPCSSLALHMPPKRTKCCLKMLHIPEAAFYMVGSLADTEEKAASLAADDLISLVDVVTLLPSLRKAPTILVQRRHRWLAVCSVTILLFSLFFGAET